jgi:replicative DNA helicase
MKQVSIIDNIKNTEQSQNEILDKKMPNNLEAEKALLGVFLLNNENVNKVADILLPQHFFIPIHQKIYSTILRFLDRNFVADPLTLKSYFAQDKDFQESKVECFDYLVKLVNDAGLVVDVKSLAEVVQDLYLRRQLMDMGEQLIIENQKLDENFSAHEKIEHAEQQLFNLAMEGEISSNFITLQNSLTGTLSDVENIITGKKKTSGLPTGFDEWDKMTGGLQNSDLIIIAARPSMGKTSFAVSMGYNIALKLHQNYIESENDDKKEQSVAVFSLEMSSKQITHRLLAIGSGIESSRIRTGSLSKKEFALLSRESHKMSSLPLFIDDSPAPTISAIRTRSRRMKRQHNLSLIIVDYLQLIQPSTKGTNINRVQEIAEISQGLKALAKELDVPVVALSQLSRAVETREDKRPQLSDLRESGNIEQDADLVSFLYREEYYLRRKMPLEETENMEWQSQLNNVKNIAEVIISKQRNGPVGSFLTYFDSPTTRFANLSNYHDKHQ